VRQRLSCLILFLGMLVVSVPAHSQTSTEPSSVTLQASSHYCGQATSPLFCFGIPLIAPDGSSGGTAWLDIYPNNTGFIALNTSSLHTTVYITGAYRTPNSIGQTASITVTFTGAADPDSDGDTDNLTGSATFSFNYVYNRLTRFYLLYVASGSVTYSIAN
jgi:hypothetical protein